MRAARRAIQAQLGAGVDRVDIELMNLLAPLFERAADRVFDRGVLGIQVCNRLGIALVE